MIELIPLAMKSDGKTPGNTLAKALKHLFYKTDKVTRYIRHLTKWT